MWKYYNDDGTEFNPDLIPKPGLCLGCRHDDDPGQEMLCNLNRHDQRNDDEFICGAFEPKAE